MSKTSGQLTDRHLTLRECLLLVGLTLGCLMPFAAKAFNIDDPLFVWTAKHIAKHPLDPYGFRANWYGQFSPMAEIMRNPPLFAYLLAGFGAVVGWSEVGLHLLLVIPAAAAVLGTYSLARRLCGAPLWAAALTLFSPVFLVSATTVMCDVTMLAFWVWALALWMRGLDEDRLTDVATAVVMATLCVLTKYNGAAVLLLMAIYALWKRRAAVLVYLSMPIAAAVGYYLFAVSHYGRSTVQSGVAMAAHFTPEALSKAFVALSFTGGCAGLALLFARGIWSMRGAVAALIGASALLVIEMTWGFPVKLEPATLATASQFVVMVAAGVGMMWMAVADFRSSRSAESAIIGLWLAGTFVFVAFISWAIGGRYLLPMAPAAAILIIRRLEATAGATGKTVARASLFALIPTALISFAVAWSDASLANSAREAANRFARDYASKETIWFQGHWGFQYYMEQGGGKPMVRGVTTLGPGDVIVIPMNNTNTFGPPPVPVGLLERVKVRTLSWVASMNHHVGAGFHADVKGPLPFVFCRVPEDLYLVIAPIPEQDHLGQ